ncbi:hypothetical protein ISS40_01940 [Candidatus Bathyarchaeota archaeon]|nr:hypothetical protein [Candidatus Bathyarchaeota archaeon]
MESEQVRVSVYACHCGLNIAGVVDCPDVAAGSADLPGGVVSEDYRYMCSDPGQEMIRNDIIQRLVRDVAGDRFITPVLYYPKILLLALGMEPKELALDIHRTSVQGAIDKTQGGTGDAAGDQ